MIEHRNIVEVLPNTVSFHFDEVVMLTTQYTSVTGLESVTFSTGEGFSNTRCVTTSYQVTLTGETALQNGIDFLGVSLSSSRALQGSFSFNSSVSYSSSYSQDRSFSATYNVSNMPYVQPNGQIAGCIVADYFEATARIKEEEYWFWGTYETIGWRTFTFRQYTFMYDSYCFGNGAFGSATGRNY
ncbi:MAG: hypothetical protein MJ239_01130 [Bacilli bacterium]|nr:hypothetical protein [Bacilli bacterium]